MVRSPELSGAPVGDPCGARGSRWRTTGRDGARCIEDRCTEHAITAVEALGTAVLTTAA